MYTSNIILATAACLSMVSGHMTLRTPKPFQFPDSSHMKDPIDPPTGSDFPCKMGDTGKYVAQGPATQMAIGEEQTLAFDGSAVHGGGSCQISLTKDLAPTKKTKWMVIHSIEGGCPARNAEGNLADGTNDPDSYKYTIPTGIEPGKYTFAWTWANRIGNREFYMNCAPIEVTGGSSKRSTYRPRRAAYDYSAADANFTKRADFPDMFLANMGPVANGCTTQEALVGLGQAIEYPNPGASVERGNGNEQLHKMTCDGHGGASGSSGSNGSDAGSSASASAAAPSAASTGASFNEPANSSAPAAAPSAAAPSAAAPAPEASSAAAAPSAAASAPAAGGSSSGSTGSTGSSGGSCTPGTFNCLGGTQFQQCVAGGTWSVAQAVAPGTKCTPGQGASLAISKA